MEYILSDTEKNDAIGYNLHEIMSFFCAKKYIGKTKKPPLSFLSHFLPAINIFAYDNKELLKKYPEGIITESLILIPVDKLLHIREAFSYVVDIDNEPKLINNSGLYSQFFVTPILECLEFNLNVKLSDIEKNIVLQDLQQFSHENLTYNSDFSFNAIKINNIDLLNSLDNKKLSLFSVLKNYNYDDYFDCLITLLKQQDFSNFPTIEKSLNKLKSLVIHDLINPKESELHHCAKNILIAQQMFEDNKSNLQLDNENDYLQFLNKSKDNLFPYLTQQNDLIFQVVLSHMFEDLFDKDTLSTNRYHLLASAIVEHCYATKRDILINIISELSTINHLKLNDDKIILNEKLSKNTHTLKM